MVKEVDQVVGSGGTENLSNSFSQGSALRTPYGILTFSHIMEGTVTHFNHRF